MDKFSFDQIFPIPIVFGEGKTLINTVTCKIKGDTEAFSGLALSFSKEKYEVGQVFKDRENDNDRIGFRPCILVFKNEQGLDVLINKLVRMKKLFKKEVNDANKV